MQCNVSTHAIQDPFTHSGVSKPDLFAINREVYLLVSDYYSKLPYVSVIPNPVTNTAVICKTKSHFAEQRSATTCD